MDICVVITGFNDEGTIMESIESVLSQSRYPEQIGFAHGPSWDSTDEFAGFYREEFDFIHWDSRINAPECGLMHLRLGALAEVETSHVMFIRSRSYLYRSSLERLHASANDPDLALAPVRFMAPESENWSWSVPGDPTNDNLLRHGPFPPSAVLWRTTLLKEHFSQLQALKLGPFSTLGWIGALREANPDLSVLEEPLVETWDFREGDHDWTQVVYSQLARLINDMPDIENFRAQLAGSLSGTNLPGDHPIFDQTISGSTGTNDDRGWLSERYPMVE